MKHYVVEFELDGASTLPHYEGYSLIAAARAYVAACKMADKGLIERLFSVCFFAGSKESMVYRILRQHMA